MTEFAGQNPGLEYVPLRDRETSAAPGTWGPAILTTIQAFPEFRFKSGALQQKFLVKNEPGLSYYEWRIVPEVGAHFPDIEHLQG